MSMSHPLPLVILLLQGLVVHTTLIDFCKQIECATSNVCHMYNGYGCYCGRTEGMEHRFEPVDDIDHCCLQHDRCYVKAMRKDSHCMPAAAPYTWLCEDDKKSPSFVTPVCKHASTECSRAICACDALAAQCLAPLDRPKHGVECTHVPIGEGKLEL